MTTRYLSTVLFAMITMACGSTTVTQAASCDTPECLDQLEGIAGQTSTTVVTTVVAGQPSVDTKTSTGGSVSTTTTTSVVAAGGSSNSSVITAAGGNADTSIPVTAGGSATTTEIPATAGGNSNTSTTTPVSTGGSNATSSSVVVIAGGSAPVTTTPTAGTQATGGSSTTTVVTAGGNAPTSTTNAAGGNTSTSSTCVPKTCDQILPAWKASDKLTKPTACGTASDGCGGLLNCGTCVSDGSPDTGCGQAPASGVNFEIDFKLYGLKPVANICGTRCVHAPEIGSCANKTSIIVCPASVPPLGLTGCQAMNNNTWCCDA